MELTLDLSHFNVNNDSNIKFEETNMLEDYVSESKIPFFDSITNVFFNRVFSNLLSINKTELNIYDTEYTLFNEDEIEITNKDRISLLLRKYISKDTKYEEITRLQILNDKIKKLLPSVSEEQYNFAENVVQDINKINKKINKYNRRLKVIDKL